jgi:hypothetical protein
MVLPNRQEPETFKPGKKGIMKIRNTEIGKHRNTWIKKAMNQGIMK